MPVCRALAAKPEVKIWRRSVFGLSDPDPLFDPQYIMGRPLEFLGSSVHFLWWQKFWTRKLEVGDFLGWPQTLWPPSSAPNAGSGSKVILFGRSRRRNAHKNFRKNRQPAFREKSIFHFPIGPHRGRKRKRIRLDMILMIKSSTRLTCKALILSGGRGSRPSWLCRLFRLLFITRVRGCNSSPVCADAATATIVSSLGVWSDIADVITRAKCCVYRFTGLRVLTPQISYSP